MIDTYIDSAQLERDDKALTRQGIKVTKYEYLQWVDLLNEEIGRLEPDHNYNPLGSTVRRAVKNLRDRGHP